ncbi:hypothetical protein BDV98DRAFT_82568 [Pterulicium gracile]|uniref:Uncharacterized protein n=1 Tax=Pterulicium gracile TaxID=1884261 RepID=A0A5C3QJG0_9AGAR|nr:hypothetical protein BDV98DRAFT_82568 [Pterula gracilis]
MTIEHPSSSFFRTFIMPDISEAHTTSLPLSSSHFRPLSSWTTSTLITLIGTTILPSKLPRRSSSVSAPSSQFCATLSARRSSSQSSLWLYRPDLLTHGVADILSGNWDYFEPLLPQMSNIIDMRLSDGGLPGIDPVYAVRYSDQGFTSVERIYMPRLSRPTIRNGIGLPCPLYFIQAPNLRCLAFNGRLGGSVVNFLPASACQLERLSCMPRLNRSILSTSSRHAPASSPLSGG